MVTEKHVHLVNQWTGDVIFTDGTHGQITNMLDEMGDFTNDPAECAVFIAHDPATDKCHVCHADTFEPIVRN